MSTQKGFSLVETLAALVISSLVLVGTATVFVNSLAMGRDASVQMDLDTQHAQLVKTLNTLPWVRSVFMADPAFEACVQGKGKSCTGYESAEGSGPHGPTLRARLQSSASGPGRILGDCFFSQNCDIRQDVQFRWVCPSDNECTQLVWTATSAADPKFKSNLFKPRVSNITLDARSLVARGQLAFNCTSKGLFSGIDYRKLDASCKSLSGALQTDYKLPARSYAGGSVAEITNPPGSTACTKGLSSLGIFSAQSSCIPDSNIPSKPEPPICTPTDMATLQNIMVKTVSMDVPSIARNCIDSAVPQYEDNLPHNALATTRFKNSCGSRYCHLLGYDSGRVTELSGDNSVLECRYSKPPAGTDNPCVSYFNSSPLISTLAVSPDDVSNACLDPTHPSFESNSINVVSRDSDEMTRYLQACGNRYCQSHGFRDGRVTEVNADPRWPIRAYVECYNEPADLFKDVTASEDDVASNCMDSANPRLDDNRPRRGFDRFMTTCGNRYCMKMGYKSGRVKEMNESGIYLVCLKAVDGG